MYGHPNNDEDLRNTWAAVFSERRRSTISIRSNRSFNLILLGLIASASITVIFITIFLGRESYAQIAQLGGFAAGFGSLLGFVWLSISIFVQVSELREQIKVRRFESAISLVERLDVTLDLTLREILNIIDKNEMVENADLVSETYLLNVADLREQVTDGYSDDSKHPGLAVHCDNYCAQIELAKSEIESLGVNQELIDIFFDRSVKMRIFEIFRSSKRSLDDLT